MKRAKKNISPPSTDLTLKEMIEAAIKDLYYPSESDEPFDYVEFGMPTENPLTENHIRIILGKVPGDLVEEITLEDFFEPLSEIQDWYGEEEKETVKGFTKLKELLCSKLSDIQVFRVGEVQVGIYLLGKTEQENQWVGVKTLSVET